MYGTGKGPISTPNGINLNHYRHGLKRVQLLKSEQNYEYYEYNDKTYEEILDLINNVLND